jgi:hypothetical protein
MAHIAIFDEHFLSNEKFTGFIEIEFWIQNRRQ